MTTVERPLVEPLPWDSDFWGVAAVRVHARTADELDAVERLARREAYDWGSLLVPSDALDLVGAAMSLGYRMVDVRVTLATSVTTGSAPIGSHRLAAPGDIEELAAIARSALRISRFYGDPRLPDDRCADFYETWIRNSIDGPMADAVLVHRGDHGIEGFVTVRSTGSHRATLPLVAVHPDRHGRGIGRSLLAASVHWLGSSGVTHADVTTQLANTAAIRLYESAGFRFQESSIWLHRWFDDNGRRDAVLAVTSGG